jgi:hypothetical protein
MFQKIGPGRQPLALIALLFLLLAVACSSATPARAGELRRLAVVGVSNKTAEGEFSNLLIAQGIAQLVAQELYDTGNYVPVEDNPEITGRIAELVALSTQAGGGNGNNDKPLEAGSLPGCDALASVKIVKFSKSRSKGGFGPFSTAKVEIAVEVEISLKDGDKPVVTSRGRGTGVTRSQSFLFQVRKDKVNFDQTSAGQATLQAVKEAVAGLPKT